MVDAVGADADVAARNVAVRPLLLEADDACLLGPRRERWVRRQGVGLLGLLANRLGRAGRLGVHSRARRARLLLSPRERVGVRALGVHLTPGLVDAEQGPVLVHPRLLRIGEAHQLRRGRARLASAARAPSDAGPGGRPLRD